MLTIFFLSEAFANLHERGIEVGKPCPDFSLKSIQYFRTDKATLKDFRGKWLILDFWHMYCSSCVESFPEVNEQQQEFSGKVQFILIGRQDKGSVIQQVFERFRKKENLNLAITYDSSLHNRFNVGACPYVIVIDDRGIVRAITLSLTSSNISDLLSGKKPLLQKVFSKDENEVFEYDSKKPLLTYGNGGIDTSFIFRSLLVPWNSSITDFRVEAISQAVSKVFGGKKKFEALGCNLETLYSYAYFGVDRSRYGDSLYGKIHNWPILEIKDSSKFIGDYPTGKNMYSYSVILPEEKGSVSFIEQTMQKDLGGYFGYSVSVETRKMPYWKLIVTGSGKKSLIPEDSIQSRPFIPQSTLYVKSIRNLMAILWAYNQSGPPFIDETGIEKSIFIYEDVILTNLNDVRRAINKYGLDIVKGEKEMKVLVFRDGTQ